MSNSTENRSGDRANRGQGRKQNNNRNRSGQRNGRQAGGGPRKRQGGGQGRQNSSSGDSSERSAPKKQPLTFWQKLLKAIGLYKEPVAPRGRRPQKKFDQPGARKSNTRAAKGGDNKGDGNKGGGKNRKPRQAPDPDKVSDKRLYVGNVSFDANESDLEELFKGAGSVRGVDIVYNRSTHRSKGFGFVEMSHLDEAKRAVEVLHDQPFMGRTLIVNEAKSNEPNDDDSDSQDNESSGDDSPKASRD